MIDPEDLPPINLVDRDVFNGDLGMVARINEEEGAVVVTLDRREVVYPYGELDTLVPAFSTTIHKRQSSEYPAVVIPIVTQHFTCWRGTRSTPASRAASSSSC